MEAIIALALLALAIIVTVAALKISRQRRSAIPAERKYENHLLPEFGEPGSITNDQRRRLNKAILDQFDLKSLSKQQAAILLDSATYIQHVWEKELGRAASEPELYLRDKAIKAILANDSYLERVIVSEESHFETREQELPDDACYRLVASILRGQS